MAVLLVFLKFSHQWRRRNDDILYERCPGADYHISPKQEKGKVSTSLRVDPPETRL